MDINQARQLIEDCGYFRVESMSGGYVAVHHGDKLICAWVTPEQAVEQVQQLCFPD